MTKTEFGDLFQRALSAAAENAELKLKKPIPRSFVIELHGPGYPGRRISPEEAVDSLYLGTNRFYRIIDVAIRELLPNKAVVFVRVSGHPPDSLSTTWDPAGSGPFKQILADRIIEPHV